MQTCLDFDEGPVSWRVDGIEVDATLTRPEGAGPFPAVIFVAGSGPTDRNWNSPLIPGDNGSAALLARALSESGFVTLRYDKRASGPHAQENVVRLQGKISMQGHLEELAGGVRLLAGRQDVDPARLFVLANSEGCIHALNYQLQAGEMGPPFAGLVLTAPPARRVGDLARAQIAAQFGTMPGGDQMLSAYDAAMAAFAAGRPVQVDENLFEGLRNIILAITNPINQPFAGELWMANPLALLAQVTAPVLIVIGTKDIQVDWQTDGPLFEALAEDHPNITIVYPEHANHVLKHEPRDRSQFTAADAVATYSAAKTELDPDTVETIRSWLCTHS